MKTSNAIQLGLIVCLLLLCMPVEAKKRTPAKVPDPTDEKIPSLKAEDEPEPDEALNLNQITEREAIYPWTYPAISFSTPTAYGAEWGQFYLGAAAANLPVNNGEASASVFGGFGLGNARKYVGLDVSATIVNVDEFTEAGYLNFRLHKAFRNRLAFAIGVESVLPWGSVVEGANYNRTFYATVTKEFRLRREHKPFSALTVSTGIGNGRFRSFDNIVNRKEQILPFGAIGLRVARPLSIVADFNALTQVNLGFTIAPFRAFRFVAGAGITGLTRASDRIPVFFVSYSDSLTSETFPLHGIFKK